MQVIFPDGRCLVEGAMLPETIFKLWTNGSHYQALVPNGWHVLVVVFFAAYRISHVY
jgi:hypothetical protein